MITDGLSYVSVLVFFASVILAAERVTGWTVMPRSLKNALVR